MRLVCNYPPKSLRENAVCQKHRAGALFFKGSSATKAGIRSECTSIETIGVEVPTPFSLDRHPGADLYDRAIPVQKIAENVTGLPM